MQRIAQTETGQAASVLTTITDDALEADCGGEDGVMVHELEITPATKAKQPAYSKDKSKPVSKFPQKQIPVNNKPEQQKSQPPPKQFSGQAAAFRKVECKFCKKNHLNHKCPLSNQERREAIKQLGACFNCFKEHRAGDCDQPHSCRKESCKGLEGYRRHHTFVCLENQARQSGAGQAEHRSNNQHRAPEKENNRRFSGQQRDDRQKRRSRSYSPMHRRSNHESRSGRSDRRRERTRSRSPQRHRSSSRRRSRSPQRHRSSSRRRSRSPQGHRSSSRHHSRSSSSRQANAVKSAEEPFAQCVNQLLMLVKNPILSAALAIPGNAATNANAANPS